MTQLSPHEQLQFDQDRLEVALQRQQTARTRIGKHFHGLRAEYLGVVVQQDLEAVEVADYEEAIPRPRTSLED